ncbi:MAG: 16S rRNA (uracil(1498)-N(3))-methyltransferase [Lachnospiraceae bacterium]|nr:16S rRNA (uracil(1498)-N(3))-methyltransferase [Lachnospiraceae bacterium]
MYKFFVEENAINESEIRIVGEDYNHIANVLRMRLGEEVLVSTGNDREYLCEIFAFLDESVALRIVDVYASNRELPARISLYQALPKGDKMETIIQKAVELGVHRIVPVVTDRVIVKLDDKKKAKKLARWNAISEAAAKQSKRDYVPEVLDPIGFKNAVKEVSDYDYKLIPYENAKGIEGSREIIAKIKSDSDNKDIAVFIGPEGGFSESEIEMAGASGINAITLGHRILRTETAGITVLSILMFMIDRD